MSERVPTAADPPAAPLKGALLMLLAAALFACMIGAIRALSATLHPFEIAFFRNVFGLLFMVPWLVRAGRAGLRTRRLRLHVLRATLGLAAMLSWFSAITLMPLSEAVALNFTLPLFATVGAAVILGEKVRLRRWTATAVGFLGVLIILRPGVEALSPVAFLPLVAAAFMAASTLCIKALSGTEPADAIVFYMVLIMTPLSAVPAWAVWRTPTPVELAWLAGIGLFATFAHMALTRSFAAADASAVLPLDYARLVFVAIIAYVAFGEVPDLWTWIGAGVIAGAAIYIAEREARIGRARAAAAAAADRAGPLGPEAG